MTYARAVAKFGEKGMMDIVGVNGYYTALAMAINVGRTPTAKDWAPCWFRCRTEPRSNSHGAERRFICWGENLTANVLALAGTIK